jgi:ATP-dependent DNA ligase
MELPVSPPTAPMLAKLQPDIPRGDGWRYEPKLDGFRAIVYRDGAEVYIESRDGRPLLRYFPELEPALKKVLPRRCVVDGEIVLSHEGRLEFDMLQLRLHPAKSRVDRLAEETPVSFIAFDLLSLGESSLLAVPLSERRKKLEKGLAKAEPLEGVPEGGSTHILVAPQTDDPDEAANWFTELERVGHDGIIAKRADSPYSPGKRTMVKVKHRRTADCVVGGYRLGKDGKGIGSLLLGVYDDEGNFHYLGHTSSFSAAERRALLEQLQPMRVDQTFEGGRTPGGQSRWSQGKEGEWVSVRPDLVCEVAYDYLQGNRFRHASTFLRWRDDKKPEDCRFDQLGI